MGVAMTLRQQWCLLSILSGMALIGFYGCQGAGGIGGVPGDGGQSITMSAPTPTPPFTAGVTLFTYILKCDGDPAGSHKINPAAGADIVFPNVRVAQGANCKVQMATDVSKLSSAEYKFTGALEGGQTIVYEGSAKTQAAPSGGKGLVIDVTLIPIYDSPERVSRAVIIPFTVTQADDKLFPKKFKLVCGMIENPGSCFKDSIKSQVKCEGVSTKAQADCTLKATSEDLQANYESKSFSISEGKANTDAETASVELLQATQASGPIKINATIQQKPTSTP